MRIRKDLMDVLTKGLGYTPEVCPACEEEMEYKVFRGVSACGHCGLEVKENITDLTGKRRVTIVRRPHENP